MKISLLQMNVTCYDREANHAALQRCADQAMAAHPDVLLLPELWDTGFYPSPILDYADPEGRHTKAFLAELARSCHVNVVGGSTAVHRGKQVYNTCFIFNRTGELVADYSKTHLFSPMGEQIEFTPGNTFTIFSLDDVKCGIAICYDLRFPELIRRLAMEGIALLFLPASWPEKRLAHWRILTQARAIENQIFVAAANAAGNFADGSPLAGHSAIIDPWGNCLAEAGRQEAIISAELDLGLREEIKQFMDVFADRNEKAYQSIASNINVCYD